MRKKLNLRILRNKRSYTFRALADVLGKHIRTAQEWHKSGMVIIEGSVPYRVLGKSVKDFHKQKQAQRKAQAGEGQFYCVACRKKVNPTAKIQTINTNKKIGKNKLSVRYVSICPNCNHTVNKFGTISAKKEKDKTQRREANTTATKVPKFTNDLSGLPLFDGL